MTKSTTISTGLVRRKVHPFHQKATTTGILLLSIRSVKMCATNKFLQQAPENVDMLWTATHKRWYQLYLSLLLGLRRER
jgi:hypothetical protein